MYKGTEYIMYFFSNQANNKTELTKADWTKRIVSCRFYCRIIGTQRIEKMLVETESVSLVDETINSNWTE